MGSLVIEKINAETINDININTGFLHNHGMFTGKDLISHCAQKSGRYRMFDSISGFPDDGSPEDSDYFVDSFIAEENKWIRLEARNVRNENIWEVQCRGGVWNTWVILPNNVQLKTKFDKKVDKSGTKQLSDENFTLEEKSKLGRLEDRYKGVFLTETALPTVGNKSGDYALVKSTDTIWVYDTKWNNTGGKTGLGDMSSKVYDPTGVKADIYELKNMKGILSYTKVQGLSGVAISGLYNDLEGKPEDFILLEDTNLDAFIQDYSNTIGQDSFAKIQNCMFVRGLSFPGLKEIPTNFFVTFSQYDSYCKVEVTNMDPLKPDVFYKVSSTAGRANIVWSSWKKVEAVNEENISSSIKTSIFRFKTGIDNVDYWYPHNLDLSKVEIISFSSCLNTHSKMAKSYKFINDNSVLNPYEVFLWDTNFCINVDNGVDPLHEMDITIRVDYIDII